MLENSGEILFDVLNEAGWGSALLVMLACCEVIWMGHVHMNMIVVGGYTACACNRGWLLSLSPHLGIVILDRMSISGDVVNLDKSATRSEVAG